jgi:hypothetical protein
LGNALEATVAIADVMFQRPRSAERGLSRGRQEWPEAAVKARRAASQTYQPGMFSSFSRTVNLPSLASLPQKMINSIKVNRHLSCRNITRYFHTKTRGHN